MKNRSSLGRGKGGRENLSGCGSLLKSWRKRESFGRMGGDPVYWG